MLQAVEQLAARLAAAGNEQAAASEQVRASIEAVAASVEETAVSVQALVRSQRTVSESAKGVQQEAEQTAGALQEVNASIGRGAQGRRVAGRLGGQPPRPPWRRRPAR